MRGQIHYNNGSNMHKLLIRQVGLNGKIGSHLISLACGHIGKVILEAVGVRE